MAEQKQQQQQILRWNDSPPITEPTAPTRSQSSLADDRSSVTAFTNDGKGALDEKDVEIDAEAVRGSHHSKRTGIRLDRRISTIRENEESGTRRKLDRSASRVPMEYRSMSIQILDSLYHIQQRKDRKNEESDSEFFARVDYHTVSVNDIYQRFNVSPQVGLDGTDVNKRLQRHGKNVLAHPRVKWLRKIFLYFCGGFSSILWIGVIVNTLCWRPLGEPNPQPYYVAVAVSILLVILVNAGFSAFQDYSTGRVMNAIMSLIPEDTTVLRDGQQTTVSATDLVPGDIVHLSTGNKVPADMRIVAASSDLRIDRSILTGESEEIAGHIETDESNFLEAKNIAFLGTHVCNGTATGVVVLTGASSVIGRINKLTNSGKEKLTLIQKEINRFIKIIIVLTISLISLLIIFWGAYLYTGVHHDFLNVVGILSNAMGLIVAFIPEGVPIAVAMTLALIAKRMKAVNVLPKSLGTVETLGCVTVVCSDKTGTLTENLMSVESVGFVDGHMQASEALAAFSSQKASSKPYPALQRLVRCGAICNDAVFEESAAVQPDVKIRAVKGNATDQSVLRFVEEASAVEAIRSAVTSVAAIPFNSRNKWKLTVIHIGDDQYEIMLKGAPDILLEYCINAVPNQGEDESATVLLDENAKQKVVDLQEAWARRGERVIVMAFKRVTLSKDFFETSAQEEQLTRMALSDLTLIGLVGIIDPPRADIPHTVSECRRAGARFMMVTGDFKLTAASIARKCGILTGGNEPYELPTMSKASTLTEKGWISGGLVLQGSDIDQLDDETWETVCRFEEVVFARTAPEQKLRIVNKYQDRKQVVAVTGDGVNDAAALKAANVGIAMINGSDVAIEAADLVLLGDFASIIGGIRLGRLVFQNLQKTISYLLPAGSYSEDWPVLLNVFFGVPLPLSSFLMIIICCFTDLGCCLTMVAETEEFDLLSLPPRDAYREHLVNLKLYGQAYLFLGTIETFCAHSMFFLYLYQTLGIPLNGLFLAYEKWGDGYYGYSADQLSKTLATGQCVYFVTLVVMQWFNLLTTRNKRLSILQSNPITRAKNGRRNLLVPLGILCSLIVAIFVTEVPGMQNLFGTASVPIRFWLIPIALGLGMLVLDDLRKLCVRTWPKGLIARIAW